MLKRAQLQFGPLLELLMRVYLSCPNCGSTSFRASSEPQIREQYEGATCLRCNTFLTAEQVKQRIEQAVREDAKLKDEIAADFDKAAKLPASYRTGRFQSDSDRGINPDGEPTSVWKPTNPEDEFA